MDSSNDDNDHEDRLSSPRSSDKKAKKRKSKNSSSASPGKLSNAADAVAAESRNLQMERDAQSKAIASGRRTTAITRPGAVPEVTEPSMMNASPPVTTYAPPSPSPSTQSRDAMAKRRARRSGAAPVPGAVMSESQSSYNSSTNAAVNTIESDMMAKNRARPPPRELQVQPTASSAGFESQRILEQRAGLRALERDVNAKNDNRLPGINDTVVDPSISKSLAEPSYSAGRQDAFSAPGPNNNNNMTRSLPPESPLQDDVLSKEFALDSPDEKDPYDMDDDGYGDTAQRNDNGDGGNHYSGEPHYASTGFGPNGEIGGGGIEAFVADQQVVDAMGVALVMSDEEQERLDKSRFRRYLWIGVCALILLTMAIVIPVVLVFGKNEGPKPTVPPTSAPSMTPSSAPTSTRFTDILDYALQFSSAESLTDHASPQFLAADWVANLDERQADLESEELAQRYLLAVFYFSTAGDEWEECSRSTTCNVGFSWLDGTQSECLWHGVRCRANQLIRILIGNQVPLGNNLQGTLPVELAFLTDMESLVLIKGTIGGTIPPEYAQWSQLTTFFIQDHLLNGTIPEELIAKTPGMDMFAVGNNMLSGPIPTSLASMPVLRDLQLQGNQFTGSIPTQFGDLSATLSKCQLHSLL